jgi:hypothetical protein
MLIRVAVAVLAVGLLSTCAGALSATREGPAVSRHIDDSCGDLGIDVNNCGHCGFVCTAGQQCHSGLCF